MVDWWLLIVYIQEQEFYQRLSRALKLDSATARVLTGDFARDAILIRAEQLAKQEVRYII